jgi:hypothetical protein
MFGAASAVILALMAQIGEQVDFLRFLPADGKPQSWGQRIMRFLAGPGWVVVGAPKLLAGSFLVVLALSSGIPAARPPIPRICMSPPSATCAQPPAGVVRDGRLRDRVAAQDQCHECLCRVARLVEFLLAADA